MIGAGEETSDLVHRGDIAIFQDCDVLPDMRVVVAAIGIDLKDEVAARRDQAHEVDNLAAGDEIGVDQRGDVKKVALGKRIVGHEVDVAGPASENTKSVLPPPGQDVIAAAAFDNIVAGAAIDDLVRRAADKDVIAGVPLMMFPGKAPSALPVEPPVPKLLLPAAGLMSNTCTYRRRRA